MQAPHVPYDVLETARCPFAEAWRLREQEERLTSVTARLEEIRVNAISCQQN